MERSELSTLLYALRFAAEKHRNERRKDAEASPYINHPIQVADVLVNEGGVTDLATIAAAVLHDTLEDTETNLEELTTSFGPEIAGLVAEVTDDKRLPKAERKRLQIEHAPTLSPKAGLVKLADKIMNVRDVASSPPHDWPLARRQEYFDWARAVVDNLRGRHPVLEARFDEAHARRP